MDLKIIETPPNPEEYIRLRQKAGLSTKSLKTAKKGLPNSLYAVQLILNDKLVAMGRVIGDGACFFQIVDIAVAPEEQGKGLGKLVMKHVEKYLEGVCSAGSYVSLLADKPEFYKKLGYKPTAPESQGMYKKF